MLKHIIISKGDNQFEKYCDLESIHLNDPSSPIHTLVGKYVDQKYTSIYIRLDAVCENLNEKISRIKQDYPHLSIIFIANGKSHDLNDLLSLKGGVDFVHTPDEPYEKVMNSIYYCEEHGGIKRAYSILNTYRKYQSDKRRKKSDRMKRLKQIVDLVNENPGKWTLGSLALKLEISKRQLQRDIEFLKECDENIVITRNGIYK